MMTVSHVCYYTTLTILRAIDSITAVSVSFTRKTFELYEGSGINAGPIVNASFTSNIIFEIIRGNDIPIQATTSLNPPIPNSIAGSTTSGDEAIEPSLSYSTPVMLTLNEVSKHVPLELIDDQIALEDSEEVNLTLSISSESTCTNANFSPFVSTTVLILDNDSKMKYCMHS